MSPLRLLPVFALSLLTACDTWFDTDREKCMSAFDDPDGALPEPGDKHLFTSTYNGKPVICGVNDAFDDTGRKVHFSITMQRGDEEPVNIQMEYIKPEIP